jgi:hypothetical protein
LIELAKQNPDPLAEGEIQEHLTIRRRDIAREEVETQEAFESRVALIKSFLLKLVDLIVHRRTISADLLGEFLDSEVIYNDYPELPEQLLGEDGDPVEDDGDDLEL